MNGNAENFVEVFGESESASNKASSGTTLVGFSVNCSWISNAFGWLSDGFAMSDDFVTIANCNLVSLIFSCNSISVQN